MSRQRPRSCSYPILLGGLLSFCAVSVPGAHRASAQSAPALTEDGRRHPQTMTRAAGAATGAYTVVAVRVEFQPDTSRFTTGAGTFDADPYLDIVPRIDPLPHDAEFFSAHLDALSNYVDRVSDGRATAEIVLLPGVVRVSKQMDQYAPIGLDASSDKEQSKLAALVGEAWTLVEEQIQPDLATLDPERTFFVLFHAGVGRDIELVGTTLEKTPLDIPSIYFGEESLARLGVTELRVGGLDVRNTAVLPRTETRPGFDFFSDSFFLAELTTNGLLAASFLNFLGVPDLFDTSTGESAIGPFGLMDPLGIFAFRGLIPPEPSAWTKVTLGWGEVVDVTPGNDLDFSLRSASDASTSDILRVWISSTEYFLVENRHRDASGDGLVLTVWDKGQLTEQRVSNGDPLFNSETIEGFSGGVVVDADDYDWALPGGLDTDGNVLNGGTLIWHIDERIIGERLSTNSVNADPNLRGVDVEEADSGQDLGEPQAGLFGPQLNLGSPFDFFYEGNPVTAITPNGRSVSLYENRFASDTYPNSNTNGGGPSFVSIEGFSSPGPVVTGSVRWLPQLDIRVTAGWPVDLASELGGVVSVGGDRTGLTICPQDGVSFIATLVALDNGDDSAVVTVRQDGTVRRILADGLQPTAVVCANERLLLLTATTDYRLVEVDHVGGGTREWLLPVPMASYSAPDRIVVDRSRATIVFTGVGETTIATIDLAGGSVTTSVAGEPSPVWGYAGSGIIATGNSERIRLLGSDGNEPAESDWVFGQSGIHLVGQPAFARDFRGELFGAAVTSDGRLVLLGSDRIVRTIDPVHDLGLGPLISESAVLADLDEDGRLDILVSSAEHLVAVSQGGAVVPGFPLRIPAPVRGQPLVVSRLEAGSTAVIAASSNGYVYAYDQSENSRLESAFPLAVGGQIETTPLIDPLSGRLYAASTSGSMVSWDVDRYVTAAWPARYRTGNQAFVDNRGGTVPDASDRLLVVDETYNWPNPVSEGRTSFRVLTTDDCAVTITVVDVAGTLIEKIGAEEVQGGVPHEVVWRTATKSGLYFARVAARSPGGREDDVLVKVAVIR